MREADTRYAAVRSTAVRDSDVEGNDVELNLSVNGDEESRKHGPSEVDEDDEDDAVHHAEAEDGVLSAFSSQQLRYVLCATCWLLSVLWAATALVVVGSWALRNPASGGYSLLASLTPWMFVGGNSSQSAADNATITAARYEYLNPNQTCIMYARHPTIPACTPPPVQPELVTDMFVAFTSCGANIQPVALTHLKSWVLHTPVSTRLHAFVLSDNVTEVRVGFEAVMARWPRRPYNLTYLDLASLPEDRKKHLGDFRRCSTARVYLPDLLPPHVERIAYTDVDSIVVSDPRPFLAQFQLYGPHTLFSFGWETPYHHGDSWYLRHNLAYPWPAPYGINAGVMLMDVWRVRAWRWRDMTYMDNMFAVFAQYGAHFELGDQDWFNAFFGATKAALGYDLWLPLPFEHNYRSMEFDPQPATLNDPDSTRRSMLLLHGNNNFFFRGGHPFDESMYGLYYWWPGWPSTAQ